MPAAGGVAQPVLERDTDKGERTYRWPDLVPGEQVVLYTLGSLDSPNDYDQAQIVACSLTTGQKRLVVERGTMPRFVPPDHLFYSRGGVLFRVGFDARRLQAVGQPTPVLEDVSGDTSSGVSYFAVALDGTLAAVRGASAQTRRLLTLVDRNGAAAADDGADRGGRRLAA